MNTICQDESLTPPALHPARNASHHAARALVCRAPARVRDSHHACACASSNPQKHVGKTFANWNPISANWIQLANGCQLNVHLNQSLKPKLADWHVGKVANLPTEPTHCFYSGYYSIPVVGDSPLPTGEVDTPTPSRGCLPKTCTLSILGGQGTQLGVTR